MADLRHQSGSGTGAAGQHGGPARWSGPGLAAGGGARPAARRHGGGGAGVWRPARAGPFPATPGDFCCSLTHRDIWQRTASDEAPGAVILEDDARLSPAFTDFMALDVTAVMTRHRLGALKLEYWPGPQRSRRFPLGVGWGRWGGDALSPAVVLLWHLRLCDHPGGRAGRAGALARDGHAGRSFPVFAPRRARLWPLAPGLSEPRARAARCRALGIGHSRRTPRHGGEGARREEPRRRFAG
ncbi:MAG: glycosyltransferase family 25 protein [Rhodobacteraceae bacterium]|nr:glycosyltransferase family 25 protein [Paracoccaceae bacterium]